LYGTSLSFSATTELFIASGELKNICYENALGCLDGLRLTSSISARFLFYVDKVLVCVFVSIRFQTFLLSFIIYEKINFGRRLSVRVTARRAALSKYETTTEQSELSTSTATDNSCTGSITRIRFRCLASLRGVKACPHWRQKSPKTVTICRKFININEACVEAQAAFLLHSEPRQ